FARGAGVLARRGDLRGAAVGAARPRVRAPVDAVLGHALVVAGRERPLEAPLAGEPVDDGLLDPDHTVLTRGENGVVLQDPPLRHLRRRGLPRREPRRLPCREPRRGTRRREGLRRTGRGRGRADRHRQQGRGRQGQDDLPYPLPYPAERRKSRHGRTWYRQCAPCFSAMAGQYPPPPPPPGPPGPSPYGRPPSGPPGQGPPVAGPPPGRPPGWFPGRPAGPPSPYRYVPVRPPRRRSAGGTIAGIFGALTSLAVVAI